MPARHGRGGAECREPDVRPKEAKRRYLNLFRIQKASWITGDEKVDSLNRLLRIELTNKVIGTNLPMYVAR
jgi:hypothetical protein